MKSLLLSIVVLLTACAEKPKPQPPKPPAQYLWMTVPGTLEDAERMGFACQRTSGEDEIRCASKNVDVLGVTVDSALTISVKNGIAAYDSIELITRWATGWERSCDSVDVDIVMLDGSIKKTTPTSPCVKDTRQELGDALIGAGWNKSSQGRDAVYTSAAHAVTIKVYMHSLVFIVMRAE